MQQPRMRFTIRRLLAGIAVFAVLLAIGLWANERYLSTPITKPYFVGDLMGHEDMSNIGLLMPRLSEQADLLKSSVTPDVFWISPRRSVTPFALNLSLIVSHTEQGHRQIADWLRERRSERPDR